MRLPVSLSFRVWLCSSFSILFRTTFKNSCSYFLWERKYSLEISKTKYSMDSMLICYEVHGAFFFLWYDEQLMYSFCFISVQRHILFFSKSSCKILKINILISLIEVGIFLLAIFYEQYLSYLYHVTLYVFSKIVHSFWQVYFLFALTQLFFIKNLLCIKDITYFIVSMYPSFDTIRQGTQIHK